MPSVQDIVQSLLDEEVISVIEFKATLAALSSPTEKTASILKFVEKLVLELEVKALNYAALLVRHPQTNQDGLNYPNEVSMSYARHLELVMDQDNTELLITNYELKRELIKALGLEQVYVAGIVSVAAIGGTSCRDVCRSIYNYLTDRFFEPIDELTLTVMMYFTTKIAERGTEQIKDHITTIHVTSGQDLPLSIKQTLGKKACYSLLSLLLLTKKLTKFTLQHTQLAQLVSRGEFITTVASHHSLGLRMITFIHEDAELRSLVAQHPEFIKAISIYYYAFETDAELKKIRPIQENICALMDTADGKVIAIGLSTSFYAILDHDLKLKLATEWPKLVSFKTRTLLLKGIVDHAMPTAREIARFIIDAVKLLNVIPDLFDGVFKQPGFKNNLNYLLQDIKCYENVFRTIQKSAHAKEVLSQFDKDAFTPLNRGLSRLIQKCLEEEKPAESVTPALSSENKRQKAKKKGKKKNTSNNAPKNKNIVSENSTEAQSPEAVVQTEIPGRISHFHSTKTMLMILSEQVTVRREPIVLLTATVLGSMIDNIIDAWPATETNPVKLPEQSMPFSLFSHHIGLQTSLFAHDAENTISDFFRNYRG